VTVASDFLALLKERQLFHQATDEAGLAAAFGKGIVTGYNGYDCTAASLHIGNLANMMMLRRLQAVGGRPLVIIGGGTTKIGDPSGKDEMRQMLTPEKIAANMESIRPAFERVLRFDDSPTGAIMVNNDEWLSKLGYVDFLRDIGRHFTINRMLTMDSVRLRLEREQPLTFIEFNYMLLQAYDFLELNRRYGCILQTGGSDQWGNIIQGIELIRRIDGKEAFGATCPLITTSSGAKMGKSVSGAVWLNADMLPDFDFWQFWRNTEDADVGRFLRIFTDMPVAEIARLEALGGAEINEAKKILATEVTALVRGREAAERAAGAAAAQFGGAGGVADLPVVTVERALFETGVPVATLFAKAGLTASSSEARRQIAGGGVRVNDAAVTDEKAALGLDALDGAGSLKLSLGKKRHVRVVAG
jgi:tyrosyl-tRNA synthetase